MHAFIIERSFEGLGKYVQGDVCTAQCDYHWRGKVPLVLSKQTLPPFKILKTQYRNRQLYYVSLRVFA